APDLDQAVHHAPPDLGLPHHLPQFLIEHLIATGPIDLRVGPGEEERHEGLEKTVQRFLPGAVIGPLRISRRCAAHGVVSLPHVMRITRNLRSTVPVTTLSLAAISAFV